MNFLILLPMRKRSKEFIAVCLIVIFGSCTENGSNTTEDEVKDSDLQTMEASPHELRNRNLNITVFLDLSDRIDIDKYHLPVMEMYQRDIESIKTIASCFTTHIENKRIRMWNDNFQIVFDPLPDNSNAYSWSQACRVKFGRQTTEEDYKNFKNNLISNVENLYSSSVSSEVFKGSDVFQFVEEVEDKNYISSDHTNFLIIYTDGYMYYEGRDHKVENRTRGILPGRTRKAFADRSEWEQRFKTGDYGFIPADVDLSGVKVMIVNVNPSENNGPTEFDLLEAYWLKWMTEMGVDEEDFLFLRTDLPDNMQSSIQSFILEQA